MIQNSHEGGAVFVCILPKKKTTGSEGLSGLSKPLNLINGSSWIQTLSLMDSAWSTSCDAPRPLFLTRGRQENHQHMLMSYSVCQAPYFFTPFHSKKKAMKHVLPTSWKCRNRGSENLSALPKISQVAEKKIGRIQMIP